MAKNEIETITVNMYGERIAPKNNAPAKAEAPAKKQKQPAKSASKPKQQRSPKNSRKQAAEEPITASPVMIADEIKPVYQSNHKPVKRTPVKIIPLGGLNEIGKNFTVFECSNDIFIVDCGLAFPDSDMPGVDVVIPDFTYVEQNADRVRGIVITHGHEDHIGALAQDCDRKGLRHAGI